MRAICAPAKRRGFTFPGLVFALALLVILASAGTLRGTALNSAENAVADKALETELSVIDRSLIAWYYDHAGELPSELDGDVLAAMGLSALDFSDITYKRSAENKFTLSAKLSDGSGVKSAHSGKELPEIEEADE